MCAAQNPADAATTTRMPFARPAVHRSVHLAIRRGLSAAVLGLAVLGAHAAEPSLYLTSKTPYAPRQDASTYEAAPAGFEPVYTELVARHGSRGLSSPSSDVALYAMWREAQARGALTKLGARLGPDLQRVSRANALLGYGVSGISVPGYGNLTQTGIDEHTALAVRLNARLGGYFAQVGATAPSSPRQIVVATSGVNRAIDSANFFRGSLVAQVPALAPLVVLAAPLTAYPATKPVAQAAGVNRFELYSHKLAAKTDLPAATDPWLPTYRASLAYQDFLASDPSMTAKVGTLVADPAVKAAARTVLLQLFKTSFLDALDQGALTFSNAGSTTYTSDDGNFSTTVTGDGGTVIAGLLDAANALYAVYSITPAMTTEVPINMSKYLPTGPLQTLAFLQDAEDFYQKGPGIAEEGAVTYAMAQALLADFFAEVDDIAAGRLAHAAKLRFTHAEVIMPFASLLGLADVFVQVPLARTYDYATNPWRGENVAPLAANVQWDVLRNSSGTLIVRMLYNERETDFKPACESARYQAGSASHYYDYAKLKACYAL